MTGFAALGGAIEGWNWAWDIRAVNARGLDIRLRIPDWIDGLEAQVRAAIAAVVKRGNVTVSLKLARDTGAGAEHIDTDALARVLAQMAEIDAAAAEAGLTLARATAADVLLARGVLVQPSPEDEAGPLARALAADMPALIDAFDAMRRSEGAALAGVLAGQLYHVAKRTQTAAELAEARRDQTSQRLKENLAKVLANADSADPDRGKSRRDRGSRPPARACRRGPGVTQDNRPRRPQARLPDAGIQPRGQHAVRQGAVHRPDRRRP